MRFILIVLLAAPIVAQVEALEDGRITDPERWGAVLAASETDSERAAALRALGRVGDAGLRPVVRAFLTSHEGAWSTELQRAAALAVALLRDPSLLGPLSRRASPASLARALGGVGELPGDGARAVVLSAVRAKDAQGDGETIEDGVVACLTYGVHVKEPVFRDDAIRVLTAKTGGSPAQVRAATYYAARHPSRPSQTLGRAVAAHLTSADALTASYATRAFARSEGAGETEAVILAATLESEAPRGVTIARLRALATLPPTAALTAVTRAMRDDEPHVRRTALETVTAWAPGLDAADRAGLAAFAAVMIDRDPVLDVRRAAVPALARLARKTFEQRLARFRLAAPWPLRVAAAESLRHLPWSRSSVAGRAAYAFRSDPDVRVRIALLESCAAKLSNKGQPEQASIAVDLINPGGVTGRAHLALAPSVDERDPVILGLIANVVKAAVAYERDAAGGVVIGDKPLRLTAVLDRLASIPSYEVESWLSVVSLAESLFALGEREAAMRTLLAAAGSGEPAVARSAASALGKLGAKAPAGASPRPRPTEGLLASRAVVHTTRGQLTLKLRPDVAPRTVANFVRLARDGYYDGILFHRVVPAFVAQAGCPGGDGWRGPGYSIRCENNDLTYRRGTLGMALAGKDTGGSQWFICLEPQPHLDIRYTVFGQIESGWDVLDALVQGDAILRIEPE